MPTNFFILLQQELVLTVIIFLLLFIKLKNNAFSNEKLLLIINIVLTINCVAGFFLHEEGSLFANMFVTNELSVLEKNMLSFATLIISVQSIAWLKNHDHVIEFYLLILASLLGMFFMISAGNILMLYVGLELSTIPLAAAANFNLQRKESGEAAMKLIISSAFSSTILLLGISFLYGATGALDFAMISQQLNASPLVIIAFVLFLIGLLFKVSAVPFHLWTADVYEGSPVSVTSFLSVVSKAAALFVLLNVCYKFFQPLQHTWHQVLVWLSLLTILIGNLFALRQQSIKRLLAFSSVAQVGFILLGMSANTTAGTASVIYFVLIYIFSNLAAFGVAALVSAIANKENIYDYKSFYTNNKFLTWVLSIALFSLAGVPPTAGFFGKFFLLMAGAPLLTYPMLAFAALNMVISMYYYLRLVKLLFINDGEMPLDKITIPIYTKIALVICLIGVLVTGLYSGAYNYIFSLQ